jgi:hypothetical protein
VQGSAHILCLSAPFHKCANAFAIQVWLATRRPTFTEQALGQTIPAFFPSSRLGEKSGMRSGRSDFPANRSAGQDLR